MNKLNSESQISRNVGNTSFMLNEKQDNQSHKNKKKRSKRDKRFTWKTKLRDKL